MSDPHCATAHHFSSPHLAWLACLGCLLTKIRKEGLMSIECDIEVPEQENSVFARFPQVRQQPYLDFATDILRMMVGGNLNAADMQIFADHAIANYTARRGLLRRKGAEVSLLNTIWLALKAGMQGYAPQVACEFGRQAIPGAIKPTFVVLEEALRQTRFSWRSKKNTEPDINIRIEEFVAGTFVTPEQRIISGCGEYSNGDD